MSETTQDLHQKYEPHPDTHGLTGQGQTEGVDYEPYPEKSIRISAQHQEIVNAITRLYSGSASEQDMQVYDEKAIYDDPLSYCDTRYKIAGQWYGIPKLFSPSKTIKTQIVSDTPSEIIFKLRQEYTPRGLGTPKTVDSLVSLALDDQGRVKYHKDQWNEKDYDHSGFGKLWKNLNGDHLTKITQPPETL